MWNRLMNAHLAIKTTVYIAMLTALVFITFWQVLLFGFWIDDWPLLWGSLYHLPAIIRFFDHPISPIQFFILSHIFGTQSIFWYIYLLLLRVIVSYLVSIFAYKVTNSRLVGFLGGVFFACSYAGFQVVNTPSSSAPLVISIPLLLSLIMFIKFLQGNKKLIWLTGGFFAIAFLFDPARALAVCFIFPFLFLFLGKSIPKQIKFFQRHILKIGLVGACIGIPLFLVYFLVFKHDSQVAFAISGLFIHPLYILSKLNRVGNFFATIGNLFIGLVVPMKQNYMDVGVYTRFFGIAGVIVFFLGIGSIYGYFKNHSKTMGLIGFFILWTFFFYIPNFLSEPRAPMAGPNRYLFLSSIGFVLLISYLISRIQKKWLVILLSTIFVLLNIYRAHALLAFSATFREAKIINTIWAEINKEVLPNSIDTIFIFSGEEPWLTQDVFYSQLGPFLLTRKTQNNFDSFPIVMRNDMTQVLSHLCNVSSFPSSQNVQIREQIPLSHVFAWEVVSPGVLINKTEIARNFYLQKAKENKCHLKQ